MLSIRYKLYRYTVYGQVIPATSTVTFVNVTFGQGCFYAVYVVTDDNVYLRPQIKIDETELLDETMQMYGRIATNRLGLGDGKTGMMPLNQYLYDTGAGFYGLALSFGGSPLPFYSSLSFAVYNADSNTHRVEHVWMLYSSL